MNNRTKHIFYNLVSLHKYKMSYPRSGMKLNHFIPRYIIDTMVEMRLIKIAKDTAFLTQKGKRIANEVYILKIAIDSTNEIKQNNLQLEKR